MEHSPLPDTAGPLDEMTVTVDADATDERDRRIGSRAQVELPAQWRPSGSDRPFTLVLLFDLSVRGARLAGWNPLHLQPGDEIDLYVEPDMRWHATVMRVIGDGEYGVRFHDVPAAAKARIATTVGMAKAGFDGWADT